MNWSISMPIYEKEFIIWSNIKKSRHIAKIQSETKLSSFPSISSDFPIFCYIEKNVPYTICCTLLLKHPREWDIGHWLSQLTQTENTKNRYTNLQFCAIRKTLIWDTNNQSKISKYSLNMILKINVLVQFLHFSTD